MPRVMNKDDLIQILNLGVGRSGLNNEHEILQAVLNKQVSRKALDGISCPECKCIVFDVSYPIDMREVFCWNCGQLVKR